MTLSVCKSVVIPPTIQLFRATLRSSMLSQTVRTRTRESLFTQTNSNTAMTRMVEVVLKQWDVETTKEMAENFWWKSVKLLRRTIRRRTSRFNHRWNSLTLKRSESVILWIDSWRMRSIRISWSDLIYLLLNCAHKWMALNKDQKSTQKLEWLMVDLHPRHIEVQWIKISPYHLQRRLVKWLWPIISRFRQK